MAQPEPLGELPVVVVLPDPGNPTSSTTVGGTGARRSGLRFAEQGDEQLVIDDPDVAAARPDRLDATTPTAFSCTRSRNWG